MQTKSNNNEKKYTIYCNILLDTHDIANKLCPKHFRTHNLQFKVFRFSHKTRNFFFLHTYTITPATMLCFSFVGSFIFSVVWFLLKNRIQNIEMYIDTILIIWFHLIHALNFLVVFRVCSLYHQKCNSIN